MKTVRSYLPGCALALVIAAAAKLLERLENAAGLQLIGASVIALFIGMLAFSDFLKKDLLFSKKSDRITPPMGV